jgi:hypothetical protein
LQQIIRQQPIIHFNFIAEFALDHQLLKAKNYLRDLAILDRGAIVVTCSVGEIKGDFAAGRTVQGNSTHALASIVGVGALQKQNKRQLTMKSKQLNI